ncbi:DUF433 domain-containing protein [Plantactinospora sp. ZYX-F-223]|uniref:DUF433 domain-containing protein n=1 Tax=Plantactinospora sp. ZYX-F-223 TaxID=3144103 RepID=UPI0031FE1A40
MAYTSALTAALGGASEGQLRNWRRQPNPVLLPEYAAPGKIRYSFRDLLAVRTLAKLRTDVSLQKIRRAVANLKDLDNFDHLSNYTLVAERDTIVWVKDDQMIDIVRRPGQHMLVTMNDVLGEFVGWTGATVVPLERPKPGLRIDPGVLRGYPVIEQTRIPFDTVSALAADGLDARSIRYFYPSVTDVGVTGAVAFE